MRKTIIILVVIAFAGLVVYFVKARREAALYNDPGFAFGNGRLEATEVNVASKPQGSDYFHYDAYVNYRFGEDKAQQMRSPEAIILHQLLCRSSHLRMAP